uniref:DENN domain-containing protein 5B n=1 Tax=Cacopsylla melanoneura TaxID=428564 RepID=A0A8D8PXI4_9HEMI
MSLKKNSHVLVHDESTACRLVDYFVISGLDIDSGLEPNNNNDGESLHCAPLEQSYQCKVLQHYPENVTSNPFDCNAVCMLSLPNGLQFKTQKHYHEPKFHSFIITKENGERYYGSSLILFEEVNNKKICSAMQILQSMHITELSSGTGTGDSMHKKQKFTQLDHNTQSLPRHFKLSSQQNKSCLSYYDFTKDSLYVCKSIALISQHAYVQAPCQFLHSLYNLWQSQSDLSIESYVFYMLYEVTMPGPATSLSFICYPNITSYLVSPGLEHELPHFDFPIRQVFMLMGVDVFIQLFTCVLLEKQILICSSDYQKLMLVAESLCCLLFPFKWPHVYVPILPSSMYHFLDAPVPYIMGLHSKESRVNIPSEFSLCFVDLDTKSVQFPEDFPSIPQKSDIMSDVYHLLNKYNVHIPNYADACLKYKPSHDVMSSSCSGALPRSRKHSWSNDLEEDTESDSLLSSSDTLRRLYIERGILMTPDSSISKGNYHETFEQTRHHGPDNFVSKSRNSLNALETSELDRDDGLSSFNSIEDRFDANLSEKEYYCKEIKFNIAIREMFLRRLVHLFANFEKFVIQNTQDKEEWLNNRDSMQNFDKTSFLSDQSKYAIPFLSLFLETQMFATFIDNKIASSWGEVDTNLNLFESRIKKYNKIQSSDVYFSSTSHEMISLISDFQLLLEKRLAKVNRELGKPKEILSNYVTRSSMGTFPTLDLVALNQEASNRAKTNTWSLKRSEKYLLDDISLYKKPFSNEANPLGSKLSNVRLSIAQAEQKISQDSSIMPQSNWNFVEKLLKDCKSRTKKMLVEKLGNEALELGHKEESNENSLVEENTLIAGLCDILEKIWSHGLQHKQGKSALWSHLSIFMELEVQSGTSPNMIANSVTTVLGRSPKMDRKLKAMAAHSPKKERVAKSPCYEKPPLPKRDHIMTSSFSERSHTAPNEKRMTTSLYEKPPPSPTDRSITSSMYKAMTSSLERNKTKSPDRSGGTERNSRRMMRRSSETRSHSETRILNDSSEEESPQLPPLPTDLSYDVKNIQSMTEIKTPIGFARAWVRLSLERKLLSKHFKTLLSNGPVLKLLYKRYAFLRCEEEKEQFLYHLLTLNAVDYNCFTNTFVNTNMTYRVLIAPSKRSSTFTSANCWISIAGNLGETKKIPIPRNTLEFIYHSKNVGQLTTLRIGHDNTGLNSKWLIEYILVRNEISGSSYKFHCGKWLGKGIDDDSIERLLIGEKLKDKSGGEDSYASTPKTPRLRSPSVQPVTRLELMGDIETMLGECINTIVKYFHRSFKDSPQHSLTVLLLGESGLVFCMEQIFLYGFKSSRLFSRNLNIWDLFIKIYQEIKSEKRTSQSYEDLTRDGNTIVDLYDEDHSRSSQLFESKLHKSETKTYFVNLIQIIEETDSLTSLGRDGRFQLFIILSVKDHMLYNILTCVVTPSISVQDMYDDKCFFKNSYHLDLILNMIHNLNTYKFSLENSLTHGINYNKIMSHRT